MRTVKTKSLIAAAGLATLAGCVGTGAKDESASGATAAEKELAPLRVAVYVGDGARNIGAYRWLEIATTAGNVTATPVDGAAVRAGALDAADVLVMPGGRAHREADSLGPEGREKVKAFVRGGGGYIGTCAGFFLVSQPTKGIRKGYLGLIPFVDTPAGCNGQARLCFAFNKKAEELAGIKKGNYMIPYSRGPVPVRTDEEVEGTRAEVLATYHSDYNPKSVPCPSKAGHPAVVAAECGKGRLFVFTCHPENEVNDAALIQGAFRYVTGREIRWRCPQRKRGQLAVGFMCDDSLGVETARLVQRLVTEGEFDVIPLNKAQIESGLLRRVDAVLAPAGTGSEKPDVGLYGGNAARTREFLARGGRVFAWGSAAEAAKERESGVTCVADAEAALAALRAFAAEPVPAPAAIPAKVAKPIRAGIFQHWSGSNLPIARMLACSPEYELKILAPEDYAAGALDGLDLLVQPGGGCAAQYKALGDKGVEALRRFILGGGKYYGVCAGAFLATQPYKATDKSEFRMGLVPFRDDEPDHYRGKAPINVALTDEGKAVFEGSATNRTVFYSGGPVVVPGTQVADTDVKVLARYAGRIINTNQPSPIEEMAGKAAFLGGRVGRGKVFLSCPHPEKEEYTSDLVRDGIKYLTGVSPSPVYRDRTRGAISVQYHASNKASVEFLFGTLDCDSRFNVWLGKGREDFPHVDAVVLTEKVTKGDADVLEGYIERGLRVVVVADTKAKRTSAEMLKGAIVVDSYDKVVDALLK